MRTSGLSDSKVNLAHADAEFAKPRKRRERSPAQRCILGTLSAAAQRLSCSYGRVVLENIGCSRSSNRAPTTTAPPPEVPPADAAKVTSAYANQVQGNLQEIILDAECTL